MRNHENADRQYKAQVIKKLNVPWRIAYKIPGMAKVWKDDGDPESPLSALCSWAEIEEQPELWIVYGKGWSQAELTRRGCKEPVINALAYGKI